jgi:hypothetical protein
MMIGRLTSARSRLAAGATAAALAVTVAACGRDIRLRPYRSVLSSAT